MATGGSAERRIDPRAVKIGEHLRTLRERGRLTQEVVAERLGLKTAAAYQHYEAGRALPGMADVPKLAAALGVMTCELFPDSVVPMEARHAPPAGPDDPESNASDNALLDLGAERLYRRWVRVLQEDEEDAETILDYLEWRRLRNHERGK